MKLPSEAGSNDGLLPVMFWIHGGGFSIGHPLEYLPNRYMEHDIVLVVIQYRLGPLGKIAIKVLNIWKKNILMIFS